MDLGNRVEDDDGRTGTRFWISQLAMTIEASPPSEWPIRMIGATCLGSAVYSSISLAESVCQRGGSGGWRRRRAP